VHAQGYKFSVIDDTLPLTEDCRPYSIIDSGEILVQPYGGQFELGVDFPRVVYPNGKVKSIGPGARDFTALSNNGSYLVGFPLPGQGTDFYAIETAALVETDIGTPYIPGTVFGNYTVYMNGLNTSGTAVGSTITKDTLEFGVVYKNSTYSKYVYPGSTGCGLTGINDSGDMVGTYYTNLDRSHYYGFALVKSKGSQIKVAGCIDVNPTAISNSGYVVGSALSTPTTGQQRLVGFVFDIKGRVQVIDYKAYAPKTVQSSVGTLALSDTYQTQVFGVNSAGKIVGEFQGVYAGGSAKQTIYIPFLGTPSE
jgi:hypothetical protein